jgi:hypothetical protein
MLELGYPKHLLAVEKSLKELASEVHTQAPRRRVDIVCFSKGLMKPLLMVECKAEELTTSALYQVMGYNRFVQASFIAIANGTQILTGWYDAEAKQYRFVENLPSYQELLNA